MREGIDDAATSGDLAWSAVLKRTFESYIRGERPNMVSVVNIPVPEPGSLVRLYSTENGCWIGKSNRSTVSYIMYYAILM